MFKPERRFWFYDLEMRGHRIFVQIGEDGCQSLAAVQDMRVAPMAEGVGFEPTVQLPVRLISSQVPSTNSATLPFVLKSGTGR